MDFDARCFGYLATAMVDDVFAKVFTQVSPTTANTNHHTLSFFSDGADKKLRGSGLTAVVQVVELNTTILCLVGV